MKISYNWLQESFDKKLPQPKELADLLNIRAFEVEDIEEKNGDSIFEIKVTPDRAPDCLSHFGIAKEVALHTKLSLVGKEFADVETDFTTDYEVVVAEKAAVRYMAREIKNVKVGESPAELKSKLEAIGQRSINTIVDITNLVMFEIGQPMHAFDTSKIIGKKISVAPPTTMNIITLDGKEIELIAEDITIQDEESNLAIAGVKGGKKAEVTSATANILLESANFVPTQVRKTSKKTGIQNDSSKRFENGLTPMLAADALNLASFYIQKYASTEATQFSNVVDVYPRPQLRPYSIGITIKYVTEKLGTPISEQEVLNILSLLGIRYQKKNVKENVLKIVNEAINKPYKWGASVLFDAPDSFDCSSLVSYAYSQSGIQIPRVSIDQFLFCPKIEKDDLELGDLIFANTGLTIHADPYYVTKEYLPGTQIEHGVDHVGIYMGDGNVLHAGSNIGHVAIEKIENSAYFKNIVGYGQLATKDEERYVLEIPYERLDLKTETDIVEEIGRIYGYEHIAPASPQLTAQDTSLSTYEKILSLKNKLTTLGFDEVVTYSFQKKGEIAVIKPLASDKAYLRVDLATGVSDALELNFKNKELFATDVVKIFEIGNVFTESGEKLMLTLGVKSASKKQKTKQILEETLGSLGFHTLDIKDQQQVIEMELTDLLENISVDTVSLAPFSTKAYVPFSPYPFMTRDVAVWANNSKTQADIEKIITDHGTDILIRYDLFDTYATEAKTSYAYRLVFQSLERTLTDEEVQPIMEKIYATLQADADFEIR